MASYSPPSSAIIKDETDDLPTFRYTLSLPRRIQQKVVSSTNAESDPDMNTHGIAAMSLSPENDTITKPSTLPTAPKSFDGESEDKWYRNVKRSGMNILDIPPMFLPANDDEPAKPYQALENHDSIQTSNHDNVRRCMPNVAMYSNENVSEFQTSGHDENPAVFGNREAPLSSGSGDDTYQALRSLGRLLNHGNTQPVRPDSSTASDHATGESIHEVNEDEWMSDDHSSMAAEDDSNRDEVVFTPDTEDSVS